MFFFTICWAVYFAHMILPTPHLTVRLGPLGTKNRRTFCTPFYHPFVCPPPIKSRVSFEASAFNFLWPAFCWPSNWVTLTPQEHQQTIFPKEYWFLASQCQYFQRNIHILMSRCSYFLGNIDILIQKIQKNILAYRAIIIILSPIYVKLLSNSGNCKIKHCLSLTT